MAKNYKENVSYDKKITQKVLTGLGKWVGQLELILSSGEEFDSLVWDKNIKSSEKRAVLKKYSNLLKTFEDMDTDLGVFVHCSIIFRRVMDQRKAKSTIKDLLYVLATCLFISFKYVIDETVCHISDFADFIDLDKEVIRSLEEGILINILNFKLKVSRN